jgi:hypothetical protein
LIEKPTACSPDAVDAATPDAPDPLKISTKTSDAGTVVGVAIVVVVTGSVVVVVVVLDGVDVEEDVGSVDGVVIDGVVETLEPGWAADAVEWRALVDVRRVTMNTTTATATAAART